MANTQKNESAKDKPTTDSTDAAQPDDSSTRTTRSADAQQTQQAQDRSSRSQGQAQGEDSEQSPSDRLRDQQAKEAQAFEDNPAHPEEAIETEYLVGGEIPANAPGTEGMAREQ